VTRPFLKVCILGAECTGKTSLTRELSAELRRRGYWAQPLAEALRLFCSRFGRLPLAADEGLILSAQTQAETAAYLGFSRLSTATVGFLFCDSSPLQTAFTSDWYFGDTTHVAKGLEHQIQYFHAYLCSPGIAWEADGIQRDGPQAQRKFHADFTAFLDEHKVSRQAIALSSSILSKNSEPARRWAEDLLCKADLPPTASPAKPLTQGDFQKSL
jgi:nicotinamide riboside kinase